MAEERILFGSSGLPYFTKRTTVPDYKHDFPFHLQPKAIKKVYNNVLDLANADDLELYNRIWDAYGVGIVMVLDEKFNWVPEKENWKVFVRWAVRAMMDPDELITEKKAKTISLTNLGVKDAT